MTLTCDGGARQPDPDLWCSYAAVRTLRWLGEKPADPPALTAFLLSRQNADGGFAWQRGLPSDVWATYYCTQALRDLGHPVPHRRLLADWLGLLRTATGGYGMTPGQPADIWATYYACRTYAEILNTAVPATGEVAGWLAGTQHRSGGLAWYPGSEQPDVRACYYGTAAWHAAGSEGRAPWDTPRLVSWVRARQGPDGGFGFAAGCAPCAWAAFRAVRALRALGSAPRDPSAAARWMASRRLAEGGYERWQGYGQADVWACFSAVGALTDLGAAPGPGDRASVATFVRRCQLPGSGFTYRDPDAAGDSLATAAALLAGTLGRRAGDAVRREDPTADARCRALSGWLRAAQLPAEGGVMYMPGRGAEVRCTLWAAEALRVAGAALDTARLREWITDLQNADGGFGAWQGRGSDLVSSVSAVETALVAGLPPSTLDVAGTLRFLDRCKGDGGYGSVPGAAPTLAATAQAARALDILSDHDAATRLASRLPRWASALGGFASTPRGMPDLISTYQAALTGQALGLPLDRAALRRFLAKVRTGSGYSWTPLGRQASGPLAACLGELLDRYTLGAVSALPRLNL